MSDAAQTPKSWLDGTPKMVMVALGAAIVIGGLGWAEAYGSRHDLQAFQARLETAGLDADSLDRLDFSLKSADRKLVEVENALVAGSAAARAREAQLAKAGATLAKIETASAAAVKSEAEAAALYADLSAKNRVLGPRVADLENAAVAAEAAYAKRRSELDGLLAAVSTNAALVDEIAMWKDKGAQLTAANETFARQVVDLQNTIVALSSAITYRKAELNTIMVGTNAAETDAHNALLATLELRAEARDLTKEIASLTEEREHTIVRLSEVNNRFIPALAAVEAREEQVRKLSAKVAKLQTENTDLSSRNTALADRLSATDGRLAQLSEAARTAAQHLAAIEDVLGEPTVQAALSEK